MLLYGALSQMTEYNFLSCISISMTSIKRKYQYKIYLTIWQFTVLIIHHAHEEPFKPNVL